jgi:ABC-type multidrug transport system fused ATPase/permease subunit
MGQLEVNLKMISNHRGNKTVFKAISRAYGWSLLFLCCCHFLIMPLKLSYPIFLHTMLVFLKNSQNKDIALRPPLYIGVLITAGLFLCGILYCILNTNIWFKFNEIVVKSYSGLLKLIENKLLASKPKENIGDILNHCSMDTPKTVETVRYGWDLFTKPISIFIPIGIMYWLLGPSALIPLAVMVLFLPCSFFIGYIVAKISLRILKAKDQRTDVVNDYLRGIRIYKMYAWEEFFIRKIENKRYNETKELLFFSFVKIIQLVIVNALPVFMSLFTFTVYVWTVCEWNDLSLRVV